MATGSKILPGRVNCRKIADQRYAVRIDDKTVGYLRGGSGSGYRWEEQPDKVWRTRVDATDMLVRWFIDEGRVDPHAPVRNLRAEAFISDITRREVLRRDEGLCQYCLMQGKRRPGTEYDHFVPASAGGSGSVENVQLACVECNRRKWHHHPEDLFGSRWKDWGPGKNRTLDAPRNW